MPLHDLMAEVDTLVHVAQEAAAFGIRKLADLTATKWDDMLTEAALPGLHKLLGSEWVKAKLLYLLETIHNDVSRAYGSDSDLTASIRGEVESAYNAAA